MTSSAYGTMPFIEDYVSTHPVKADYGKTWNLSLPEGSYWYDEKATGAGPPAGNGARRAKTVRSEGGTGA